MNDINLKRKLFLDDFLSAQQVMDTYVKNIGPGVSKKIRRLFMTPKYYSRYLWWKINNRLKIIDATSRRAKLFWGKYISLDLEDADALSLYTFGLVPAREEYPLTKYFIRNLEGTDIFYDLGANSGFYTHLALEFVKEVHVFDPMPQIFEVLRKNFEHDKRVVLNNVAVADTEEPVTLYISESSVISTISTESLEAHQWKGDSQITIPACTIDSYISSHAAPSVLKIDVEGAEYRVLKGGENFFKNHNPVIAMEVWQEQQGGEISMKAVELLRSFGYRSYRIDKEGDCMQVEGNLSMIISVEDLYENFIFKKQ